MAINYLAPWTKKAVTKREEEHPAYSLQKEMNELFNNFFRTWDLPATFENVEEGMTNYNPKVEIRETDKELIVTAELPGITDKDVTVSVTKDYLTISGEKKSEKEEDAKGYYRMERSYGSFKRMMALPYEVDNEKAKASVKDGILTVTLPKTPDTQKATKTIPVNKG